MELLDFQLLPAFRQLSRVAYKRQQLKKTQFHSDNQEKLNRIIFAEDLNLAYLNLTFLLFVFFHDTLNDSFSD